MEGAYGSFITRLYSPEIWNDKTGPLIESLAEDIRKIPAALVKP
jgi:hypothetical protein